MPKSMKSNLPSTRFLIEAHQRSDFNVCRLVTTIKELIQFVWKLLRKNGLEDLRSARPSYGCGLPNAALL